MDQARQALAKAVAAGYRVVITKHIDYGIMFFDKERIVFVSWQYIRHTKHLF